MNLEQQLLEVSSSLNPETVGLITSSIDRVWAAVWWLAGTCVSGFLFLALWIRMKPGNSFVKDIEKITIILKELRDAIVGTVDKRGIISRHYDLEKEIEVLKDDIKSIEEKIK